LFYWAYEMFKNQILISFHLPNFQPMKSITNQRILMVLFLVLDTNFSPPLQTIYKISFGQIYLSKPMMTESDGETATLFPKAARLRNLTYSAPLYVDVSKRVIKKGHDGEEVTETQDFTKVFIGKVCNLNSLSMNGLIQLCELTAMFCVLSCISRFQ
jgi:DNA-directed RNA polymerase beta subunit